MAITRLRNHLFEIGYKKSIEFDIPVISVGNLIAGGSGKTPMVEYLVRNLQDNFSVCTLSRGYGRKTRGFRLASNTDTSLTIGDEPFQFFKKFQQKISVAVGEERALAITEILFHKPGINLVLLDDAYQHRYVKPSFNILLTEYKRPFFKDHVLPLGLLRESRAGAKRADAVVVSKCPDTLEEIEKDYYLKSIGKYAITKPVFFTSITYGDFLPKKAVINQNVNVVSLTGIGNPEPFEKHLSDNYSLKDSIRFPDHHRFAEKDIAKIIEQVLKYGKETIVMTTEKDYGRLQPFLSQFSTNGIKVFYLPIEIRFLFDKNKFDKLVTDAIIAVQMGKH